MRIVNFEVDSNEIQIVPLADLHIGSPQCDENLIKEVTEYIANTPNCYTLLNGDIVDNNVRNSVGSVFEQTMSPADQVVRATYYLKEIAEKKKIINITVGNHEARSEKDTGLSPMDLLLAKLMSYDNTLNDRYCVDGAFTFLSMRTEKVAKKQYPCFTIFNLHGNGSGAKIGGKIQRLDDMSSVIQANVYIRSHTHIPETHRGVHFSVSSQRKTVHEEQCVFVNTNAFLKYGGYGARNGMKPLARAIPVITLRAKRKCHGNEDYIRKEVECILKESL